VHESDSFISEVSEEVRRDRFYAALRRYRWLIGAAVLLIVGGAAVNEWWKAHRQAQAEAVGDALQAAYAEPDPATRAGMLADFAGTAPRAAVVARLAEAGSLADAGETDQAAVLLEAVAGDGSVSELYRSLASLQRVMLLGSDMAPSERQATLKLLAAPDAPFRPLALEQRALMHLDAGDTEMAIDDLEAVLAEPGVTEALRGRAQQLLIAAGGALPAASADG
jgi:hypothetical protein